MPALNLPEDALTVADLLEFHLDSLDGADKVAVPRETEGAFYAFVGSVSAPALVAETPNGLVLSSASGAPNAVVLLPAEDGAGLDADALRAALLTLPGGLWALAYDPCVPGFLLPVLSSGPESFDVGSGGDALLDGEFPGVVLGCEED